MQKQKRTMRNKGRFLAKILLIVLVFGVLAGYSYVKTQDFVQGPRITLIEPKTTVATSSIIRVTGVAERIAHIELNGHPILIDEKEGLFDEKLLLYPGYNIITITAKDRFQHSAREVIEVAYHPTSY